MEFDEMKKIWDFQNNEPLYGINEKALHNRILSKKKQAQHITNFSELLCIIMYTFTGSFIVGLNLFKQSGNIYMFVLAVWMLCIAIYLSVSRIRRINGSHMFDQSMRGSLSHALSVARYQVRFSLLMRWNILPMGILILLGVWEKKRSLWIALAIVIFFVVTNYAAGWEHSIYKAKERELETLKIKLENE